jgi:hypothetical protein
MPEIKRPPAGKPPGVKPGESVHRGGAAVPPPAPQMSYRQWLAGQALTGLARSPTVKDTDEAVHLAVQLADKLIVALDKPKAE